MASLSADVRARYINVVDSILRDADLTTISAKAVRRGIQDQVDHDITPHKAYINELITERFDVANARRNGDTAPITSVESRPTTAETNGTYKVTPKLPPSPSPASTVTKRDADSEPVSDVTDKVPPKKKPRSSIVDDAAFAAKLQAEEDKLARPTRGAATRKSIPTKKKSPKKKASAKVVDSDDSDMDSDAPQKPRSNTGFHKLLNLSPALSSLFDGEVQMSRPQTTKRIWQYIKANDLQDPSDRRFIICDDRLREVFKQDKVNMFTMTKLISQQMYSPDE